MLMHALNFKEGILSLYYKCILSAITDKLNVSKHMLIRAFFSCSGMLNSCLKITWAFSYTLYNVEWQERKCAGFRRK
jgi:hypothetical protein